MDFKGFVYLLQERSEMFCKTTSAVLIGMSSEMITVETDVSGGLPYFDMVGYLSAEVKEAKERVRTAVRNAGFKLEPRRVIVNLSPADVRKSGTMCDLAIAAAVLCAYGFIAQDKLNDVLLIGELSLDGSVRSVNGVLSVVLMARKLGISKCIVPSVNAFEGAAVDDIEVYGIHTLKELIGLLNGSCYVEAAYTDKEALLDQSGKRMPKIDFSDISGQRTMKRGLEIAAAGMHHTMLIGPPGAGKSMAARRLPTILPGMTWDECLEVSEIYSAAGLLKASEGLITSRPFRSPHHTASDVALAGGGRVPKPGEISLAHRGVLFLDELTEFSSAAMEVMRQPIETGKIMINRLQAMCEFPAGFMLVAAINPCRCGYYPDVKKCHCTPLQIRRYIGRISQPLMDRIDLNIEVLPVRIDALQEPSEEESSGEILKRVEKARRIQDERYEGTNYRYNSQLHDRDVEFYCTIGRAERELMRRIYEKYDLSARSYHKILKVARTIADLSGHSTISTEDISEAVFYKCLDGRYWGNNDGKG